MLKISWGLSILGQAKTKVYKFLSSFNELKWSIAGKGVLGGFVAGLLAVFYRLGIEYGTDTSIKIYAYFRIHPILILPWVVAIAAAGLFIAWLVKLEPMAAGSGIPQVEGVVLFGLKMKWYTVLTVRFVAAFYAPFLDCRLDVKDHLFKSEPPVAKPWRRD